MKTFVVLVSTGLADKDSVFARIWADFFGIVPLFPVIGQSPWLVQDDGLFSNHGLVAVGAIYVFLCPLSCLVLILQVLVIGYCMLSFQVL